MDVKDSAGKGSEGNEKHVIKTGGEPILIVLIEGFSLLVSWDYVEIKIYK